MAFCARRVTGCHVNKRRARAHHADERDGQRVGEEVLLDRDGLLDDGLDRVRVRPPAEVLEEQAGKVGVQALVARDAVRAVNPSTRNRRRRHAQLVGERQAGHEAALLEPKDGRKRAGEEDALDGGKGDEALAKGGLGVGDPGQRPVGLALDGRDCACASASGMMVVTARTRLNRVEEVGAALRVADVRIDEEGVDLAVDVLHHDLCASQLLRRPNGMATRTWKP